jgi:hypothetical protein
MERLARGVLRRQPVRMPAPEQVRLMADYKPITELTPDSRPDTAEGVT